MKTTSKEKKKTTAGRRKKSRASHFMAYTSRDYCPRCRMHTAGVTRLMCSPGTFRRVNCNEDERQGSHLHCTCQQCHREWTMLPSPIPEHMAFY